ncbi:hypothetical protein CFAEC_08345 [Corynebacterium faecale]|uniref:CueP family metal-binding protein n=1 Tax=Corynebacterium faecale TaxID=1758466 RepID=UPI0025B289DC|nr:CueP family metal-binding protein [Corynebacterium faecale]WJY92486.1 hypothetical protein CFAEC_08345 [Corynebacterium faecale]
MKRAAIVLAAISLGLAGCATTESDSAVAGQVGGQDLLVSQGLAGMDAREIIEELDQQALADRPTDFIASVRTDQLILSDQSREMALDLPENLTYISIAPYLNQTHDCFYHSLTTCQGELGNERVHVKITDEASGEVLVNEETTTFDNGFVGFWLPDDAEGIIEVNHQGSTGTVDFSTTDDGATCVTNLRLT